MGKNIAFINIRLSMDSDSYICEIPQYELFIAKAVQERDPETTIHIHTLFSHESVSDIYGELKQADVVIFWDTYARASKYLGKYFDFAADIKRDLGTMVIFGGYWPTSYGGDFPEFNVYDKLLRGFSIDRVAEVLTDGFSEEFIQDCTGPSGYNTYPLDTSYIASDPARYVVFDILRGYVSSFGCKGGCKFCVNEMYRELGAPLCERSVAQIRADIDALLDWADCKSINFRDDNFFADMERANTCIEYVRSKGKSIDSNLTARVADVDEKFFAQIKDWSLTKNIFFGLESFEAEERKMFGKPFSDQKLLDFFEVAQSRGFIFSGNLILGFPFQSAESILNQVRTAVEMSHRYPGLTLSSAAYIPKHGTSFQKDFFPGLHSKIDFFQLVNIYQSRVQDIQESVYGSRFNSINLEKIKVSFEALDAIKKLQFFFPGWAQWILKGARWTMERHLLTGAKGRLLNRVLNSRNTIKARRVLTRLCIRYNKVFGK